MLDGGSDDVTAFVTKCLRNADKSPVIRFGAAAGEKDLIRICSDHRGGALTCLGKCLF